jgi:cobalt/nickel transport system ATP-binding protein
MGMDIHDTVIKLEGIYFSYSPEHIVLEDLNLAIGRGERLALEGPNGSGKTTLFHLIMGLLSPDAGTVQVFGKQRVSKGDFFEVRRRVGLLFQDSDDQLFSPTVAEDIAFGPFNLGRSREEVLKIVRRTLERIGLSGFENRVTYKLSGGEKRLVALGTVLAMNPEVLLLDEPVIGIDDEHRSRFIDIVKKSDRSFMIISHDHAFLDEVATRRCTLSRGKLVDS